jgi:hypothetical protein
MASRPQYQSGSAPRWSGVPNRGCTAAAANGEPCRSPALSGELYCRMHHPDHAAEVAQARRVGGQHRKQEAVLSAAFDIGDLRTIEGNQRLLEVAAFETLALPNSLPRNRALIAVATANAKLIEQTELAARIAALEFAVGLEGKSQPLEEPAFPEPQP